MTLYQLYENFLTSGHEFQEHEILLKYRYGLLNGVFLFGMVVAAIIAGVRLSLDVTPSGYIDLAFVMMFASFILLLRGNKNNFERIADFNTFSSFVMFTALTLVIPPDQGKMLLYAIFIVAAFAIKGAAVGSIATVLTLVAVDTMYFLKLENISFSHLELFTINMAYFTIGALSLFSTKAQMKTLEDLERSSHKIQSQQKQLYQQLRSDPYTHLPNEYALDEFIRQNPEKECSILLMDIDAFETITSEFGKAFSDQIIVQIYQTLKTFEAEHIKLYHLLSDRFAFVFTLQNGEEDLNLAKSIKALFENIHLSHKEIDISITISTGIARGSGEKAKLWSSVALSEVKKNGKNNYKLFENSTQYEEEQKHNIYWAKRIKEIILENNLVVYYQPIINNKTDKIEKYECLARAIDGDTVVPPGFFLEVARSRGYMKNITRTIIDKSFQTFHNLDVDFSINITQDDLKDHDIIHFLKYKLNQYQIDPSRIVLEILENVTSLQNSMTSNIFKTFKEMGFQIAIDDFGTETSNFSRLLALDVDIIKIDGSFIKNLDTDYNSMKIVSTIVEFAQKMGAKTVAEYVHNEMIDTIVKDLGVDYSQGYYISAPLPQIDENIHTKKPKVITSNADIQS